MQIKMLSFLSIMLISFVSTNVFAGVFYKFSLDPDGQQVRRQDLRSDPSFKNATFTTGICDGKSGSGKYCVKMFNDVQVQSMQQAIQIAKDYALQIRDHKITCDEQYYGCEMLGCDDHIYCSTANNNAHYEFVFDDIKQHGDSGYKEGIAAAYCKMFFGEQSTLDKKNKDYSNSTVSSNDMLICWPASSYKQDFIYDTCIKMGNTMEKSMGYYTIPDNYSCTVNFRTIKCSQGYIDDTFKSLQVNLDSNTIMWLAGYVQKQKGMSVNEFKCDLAAHTCKTGEMTNPNDDVLTCYADGERIDFQFDDLSETKGKWIKASEDAKECISADGVFDGRRCQGIDRAACDKLKTDKNIDIRWDDRLKACVLKSANSVANINRTAEIAATVGVAAGITAATVVTGGSTTLVLLAVGATVTATGSQIATSVERDKIAQFESELLACKPNPVFHEAERNCVRDKMIWFIDHGSNYINDLTPEQIDSVDKALAKKLSSLDMNSDDDKDLLAAFEKSKDKSMWERCTGDMLQAGKCTLDAASIILDFLPVTRMALKAPEALGTFVAKVGKKLPNTSKALLKMKTSAKVVKQGLKVIDKIDTINDVSSAATAAGIIQ